MAHRLCEHPGGRRRAGLCASRQRSSCVRRAQVTPDAPQQASTSYVEADLDAEPGRRVQLAASTSGHRRVEEGPKPLSEYMALPASQYSVLDGSQVERLDGDTFRVYVPEFKFFAIEVQPVLTLQVEATSRGCVISMLACKLKGSKLVEAQNTQFAARMRNTVAWRECETPACDDITSDVRIDVDIVVPKWFVLPKAVVRTTGNAVMAAIVNAAVPKFLEQLEADYRAWAAGDESRQPLSDGDLLSSPDDVSGSGREE